MASILFLLRMSNSLTNRPYLKRGPQSSQSLPSPQRLVTDPSPPSSHWPSWAQIQSLLQTVSFLQLLPAIIIVQPMATRNVFRKEKSVDCFIVDYQVSHHNAETSPTIQLRRGYSLQIFSPALTNAPRSLPDSTPGTIVNRIPPYKPFLRGYPWAYQRLGKGQGLWICPP